MTLDGISSVWRRRLSVRKNSALNLLLDRLASNSILSMNSAKRLTGRSYEAARQAMLRLVDAGILT